MRVIQNLSMCPVRAEVVSADAGCCFFFHLRFRFDFGLIGMTTMANQFTNSNSYNYVTIPRSQIPDPRSQDLQKAKKDVAVQQNTAPVFLSLWERVD